MIYANPKHPPEQLHALLNSVKAHPKSLVLGDFNAHHPLWSVKSNSRGREVARWGQQRNLEQLVPYGSTTWRKGNATSTLDLIFSSSTVLFHPLPHHLTFLTSDHCILAGEVSGRRPDTHTYTTIDWDFFTEYAEDPPPYTSHTFGQAFQDLKDLVSQHHLTKTASSHSKKWWDEEINVQLNRCRKARNPQEFKTQKKALTKLIRHKKRSCWSKFLQENGKKDPWEVVRIAKDPFHMKARLQSINDKGKILTSQQDILKAFRRQHFLSDRRLEGPDQPAPTHKPCRLPLPSTVRAILQALSKTSNNSTPGPDGISFRLLKIIKDTDLGQAVINDIAYNVDNPDHSSPPWKALNMVMIPKPGKDHSSLQGWRPIVLSNTCSKLGEKVIADRLQRAHGGFHPLQYGSRKGRSAIDAMAIIISHTLRETREGARVSLLGKDIVSAFNHLRRQPTLTKIQSCSPENLRFVEQFLTPHHLQIGWDGAYRGEAYMSEGTPQGSPLSPVLWLLFLAGTLERADQRIRDISLQPARNTHHRSAKTAQSGPLPTLKVKLVSYADDVNALIITRNTSIKEHKRIGKAVDLSLADTAREDKLDWDARKDSLVHFFMGPRHSTTTLGITINSELSFQEQIDARTAKAERIWQVMKRLGNSHGGMSPLALKALYTGMVRPIFTWGAELWLHRPGSYNTFQRLEYQALRKITGAYHGASHEKLGLIANIEPIQSKLTDMGVCWAAKAIATGDPHIRAFLEDSPRGFPAWHDGTGGPQPILESPISAAFHLTAIASPEEISWGDAQSHRQGQLRQISLLQPQDPRSREKGYWAASLAQLTKDGWTLAFSDGTERGSEVASGAFIQDSKDKGEKVGEFLGNLASVADGERKGITLAIQKAPPDRKVCILSDSSTAIRTALSLSSGAPPRSGIEMELREAFLERGHTTAIAWIRGHLGLDGNTIADELAELHSHLEVVSLHPRTATCEGIKAASRAIRAKSRTQAGFGSRRTDWHRHALSAYTWYRTEKGPQRAWLHQIRKIDNPACSCGHPRQTGEHIVFHCSRHNLNRDRLLKGKRTWEDLDKPDWRKEGDDSYDAIESFFDYLYFES